MQIFDTDVAPAVAEARLLHPQDHGYFTVAAKVGEDRWKEDHFHMSKLDEVSHSLRGRADTYISQASFATRLRRCFNTKSLRCVFVDLDTYNRGGNESPEQLADQVIARAQEVGIPKPSYIASSGRGLYAKWVFNDPVNAGLLPSWKLLQRKLVSAYLPMGADTKVVDPARVLRLQETTNSKNGGSVRLITQDQTHSFSDLFRYADHLEILKRAKDGRISKAHQTVSRHGKKLHSSELTSDAALTDLEGLGLFSSMHEPAMMARMGLQSLNWSRFLDLRDLVIRRGGVHRGSRDMILFWMVSFLAQAQIINTANFWTEVAALLASFPTGRDFNPMQDGSLSTLYERIRCQEQGQKIVHAGQSFSPIYTPSNDTLINMLQISQEEEEGLRTIISDSEKRSRADAKAPGRADRRLERTEAREAAVAMQGQGMTPSEIARTLGKNRSTIGRWLTPEPTAGRPYVETRGRRRRAHATRPRTLLTGRGPVTVGGAPEPSTHPCARTPFSDAELRARTKIRPEKQHLCRTRTAWAHEQLREWLGQRGLVLHRRAVERAACIEQASEEAIEAQANLLVSELIEHLQRSARRSGDQISISVSGTLSSNPTTGPPPNIAF